MSCSSTMVEAPPFMAPMVHALPSFSCASRPNRYCQCCSQVVFILFVMLPQSLRPRDATRPRPLFLTPDVDAGARCVYGATGAAVPYICVLSRARVIHGTEPGQPHPPARHFLRRVHHTLVSLGCWEGCCLSGLWCRQCASVDLAITWLLVLQASFAVLAT
jgi:hypothetical protein